MCKYQNDIQCIKLSWSEEKLNITYSILKTCIVGIINIDASITASNAVMEGQPQNFGTIVVFEVLFDLGKKFMANGLIFFRSHCWSHGGGKGHNCQDKQLHVAGSQLSLFCKTCLRYFYSLSTVFWRVLLSSFIIAGVSLCRVLPNHMGQLCHYVIMSFFLLTFTAWQLSSSLMTSIKPVYLRYRFESASCTECTI